MALVSFLTADSAWCATHARQHRAALREPVWTIVTGRFVLADGRFTTSPDGDTVRFVPDGDSPCRGRPCPHGINVRIASVDALELHYQCGHQHLALATSGRDQLLSLLGFKRVAFRADGDMPTVLSSTPESVRGYLVATGPDTWGKRIAAYLYTGEPPRPDGSPVKLSARDIRRSVNYALLSNGAAYPAYFADSVTPEVMDALDEAVELARARAAGIWGARSQTATGGVGATDIIWPPVARKFCSWVRNGGSGTPGGFVRWLTGPAKHDGYIYWDRVRKRRLRLGQVVRVEGDALVLTVPPESLVARQRLRHHLAARQ